MYILIYTIFIFMPMETTMSTGTAEFSSVTKCREAGQVVGAVAGGELLVEREGWNIVMKDKITTVKWQCFQK